MASTHRIIQIGNTLDCVRAHAQLLRRCSCKAVEIGNRGACEYWIAQAQKCDRIVMRCTLILGRDWSQRNRAAA